MTLPMWNTDRERPDLLRGKRGWTVPDYVNIGIGVCLVVVALGLLVPAVARIRETDSWANRTNGQREHEFIHSRSD